MLIFFLRLQWWDMRINMTQSRLWTDLNYLRITNTMTQPSLCNSNRNGAMRIFFLLLQWWGI